MADVDSDIEDPVLARRTPTSANERRKKMARLKRLFGTEVPVHLVFPSSTSKEVHNPVQPLEDVDVNSMETTWDSDSGTDEQGGYQLRPLLRQQTVQDIPAKVHGTDPTTHNIFPQLAQDAEVWVSPDTALGEIGRHSQSSTSFISTSPLEDQDHLALTFLPKTYDPPLVEEPENIDESVSLGPTSRFSNTHTVDTLGSGDSLYTAWFDDEEPSQEDDPRVAKLVARLTTIFDDKQQYRRLLKYRGADAQKLLDAFQILLDTPGISAQFRRNLLVAAQRLAKAAGVYPESYNLHDVKLESEDPIAAGSFADIYKGHFQGKAVCLKVIRLYQSSHADAFLKHFSAEAILWGQLSHPNLLPIYGLYRYTVRVCLVSPWMDHGDVMSFLAKYPDECRTLLVTDVTSGISYLHARDIVHGDLKGVNILINSSRRACLADFGLSAVSDPNILHWTSHSSAGSKGGSVRWQAPELFDFGSETVVHNTKLTDVYAFACVAYEIYTDTIPFSDIPRDPAVMFKVQSGLRPSKPGASSRVWGPQRLTERIWKLMEACWSADPQARPTIAELHEDLVGLAAGNWVVDDRPVRYVDALSPGHFRTAAAVVRTELSEEVEGMLDRLSTSSEPGSGVVS